MFCPNCGTNVSDSEKFCPNCGAQNLNTNLGGQEVKATGVLIASILEMASIVLGFIPSFITGLIALILILVKLNPAIQSGNLAEAKKVKKTIKIVLWIGIGLIILIFVLFVVLSVLILVPNFSGIQERMEVRADRATAAQIGTLARIWYEEAKYEGFDYENVEKGFVELDEVDGFKNYYGYTGYPVGSYVDNVNGGKYYVTIIKEGTTDEKVVVAIGPEDLEHVPTTDKTFTKTFNDNGENSITITYDGTGSGIAYIEP